ncbi:hypothetical protein COO60DRAFT_413314 [Scenedesmus sp. NREL 46B-D3]|nr:hypothetical protein COO60DRAFT_413314 [Scenedesmus sp. NREL 46B-D3]
MSAAMDVYAFCVVMWEAAAGVTAFKQLHQSGFYKAVVVQGLGPQLPAAMPPDYAGLMQRFWATAPADRPAAGRLVEAVAALDAAPQPRSS